MIGGLILYVRAPSLDHFVFENKNVKILFRFCRRHYFDLRIIVVRAKIPLKANMSILDKRTIAL